jgi:cytochrome c peroxidase
MLILIINAMQSRAISKRLHYFFIFLIGLFIFSSCKKTYEPTSKELVKAPYFTDSIPHPKRNPFTSEGIRLGRKLFFDPALSSNGKVSCASCHHPEKFFSDGVALSNKGVSGKKLERHAPALFNMAWHPAFFWDGGAKDLESQMFGPLTHPDEMAANLNDVLQYLNEDEEYRNLFYQAFDKDTVQSAFMARALAQYVRTLISDNSAFDQYKNGKNNLDSLTLAGYKLFQTKQCNSCHPEPFFMDFNYHNTGLDSVLIPGNLEINLGRYRITRDSADIGKYKTPSLRNAARTAPYMHDGRFETLEEVLEHYNNGVHDFPTVDKKLKDGIDLSEKEKKALIAFIESLTE